MTNLFRKSDYFFLKLQIHLPPYCTTGSLLFPCVLMVIFLCMYKYVPNRKTTFFNELPGAVFAATGWFLFSYFYSVYVNHSPNFSLMYGSLSTLVFALMWMYFCMIIVFLGAELNMISYKKAFRRLWFLDRRTLIYLCNSYLVLSWHLRHSGSCLCHVRNRLP